MTATADDLGWMKAALGLARRGLGACWPNPAVGCVIVRDGALVASGWTHEGGRPHAEAVALAKAGDAARGATAYVTLEPCCHGGRGPACADGLVASGIARAVVALDDPDERVSGGGYARLSAAGIAVERHVREAEAADILQGYLSRLRQGRPLVAFKTATTLDGRIATRSGESRWITGEAARMRAQLLRAAHDGIIVGAATAIADDPALTLRLPGLTRRPPVRIVADRRLRTPLTHQLVRTARDMPTWILTSDVDAAEDRRAAYRDAGVDLIDVGLDPNGRLDMADAMKVLAARGLTSVLVEGGGHLGASLMAARLIDRIYWFRAGSILGGDAVPALAALGLGHLRDAPRYARSDTQPVGDDLLETYRRAA